MPYPSGLSCSCDQAVLEGGKHCLARLLWCTSGKAKLNRIVADDDLHRLMGRVSSTVIVCLSALVWAYRRHLYMDGDVGHDC